MSKTCKWCGAEVKIDGRISLSSCCTLTRWVCGSKSLYCRYRDKENSEQTDPCRIRQLKAQLADTEKEAFVLNSKANVLEKRVGDLSAIIEQMQRNETAGFCLCCGATVPHRTGESRCPDCIHHAPEGQRGNLENVSPKQENGNTSG